MKNIEHLYPTTYGNRAHLIMTQRDMLIPQSNFVAQLQKYDK